MSTAPSQPSKTVRYASPQARINAIKEHAIDLIAADKLEFTEKTPKKIEIARQFEIKTVRPHTYAALELKNGDVVLKKVLIGGFRPGEGMCTKPMKFDELTKT